MERTEWHELKEGNEGERKVVFFVAACTFLFVHAHIRKKQIQRYTEHKWMRIACVCTLGLSH